MCIRDRLTGYGGEHRIVITREGAMDELLIRVEPTQEVFSNLQRQRAFEQEVHGRILKTLAVRAVVELVEPASFPRTDFKARRVIDDREVFRELNQKLKA